MYVKSLSTMNQYSELVSKQYPSSFSFFFFRNSFQYWSKNRETELHPRNWWYPGKFLSLGKYLPSSSGLPALRQVEVCKCAEICLFLRSNGFRERLRGISKSSLAESQSVTKPVGTFQLSTTANFLDVLTATAGPTVLANEVRIKVN